MNLVGVNRESEDSLLADYLFLRQVWPVVEQRVPITDTNQDIEMRHGRTVSEEWSVGSTGGFEIKTGSC